MKAIKFPGGLVGEELLHYMGADDEQNLSEKSEASKRLAKKCRPGKVCELDSEEQTQLISDAETAIDILHEHVGDEDWSGLHQYRLGQFLSKLRKL